MFALIQQVGDNHRQSACEGLRQQPPSLQVDQDRCVRDQDDHGRSGELPHQATIQAGRQMARQGQGELLIHGQDGRIRARDSYGNDPCPPKDSK